MPLRVGGVHPAVFFGVAAVVVAIDAATKQLVLNSLEPGEVRDLVGSVLRLTLVRNPGAAFSFATNATWVLTLVATAVAIGVVVVSRRAVSLVWTLALGLVLGGALGNLADRFFRDPGFLRGHVVDFLELPDFPVFNLADSAIVCGAVLVVLLTLLGRTLDGQRLRSTAP